MLEDFHPQTPDEPPFPESGSGPGPGDRIPTLEYGMVAAVISPQGV